MRGRKPVDFPVSKFQSTRNARYYLDNDFVKISNHFRNAAFTFQLLGLSQQGFRKRSLLLGCYYPRRLKDGSLNPNYNPNVPKLEFLTISSGKKAGWHTINPEYTDKIIKEIIPDYQSLDFSRLNYGTNLPFGASVNQTSMPVVPSNFDEMFSSYISKAVDAKMAMMQEEIANKFTAKTIIPLLIQALTTYQNPVPTLPATKEVIKEVVREVPVEVVKPVEVIKEVVKEVPVVKEIKTEVQFLQRMDEIAKELGYPTRFEFLRLMENYDNYIQIAKFKGVSATTVGKWARFHGILSDPAIKRKNNLT